MEIQEIKLQHGFVEVKDAGTNEEIRDDHHRIGMSPTAGYQTDEMSGTSYLPT